MSPDTDDTDLYIQAARHSFASYMTFVHETDMPWIAGGRAEPAAHMLPIVAKYETVAHIVLRRAEGWEEWTKSNKRHTSVVAPPGSAKTTILQYFFEWLIGQASICWGGRWADMLHLALVQSSQDQALRVSFAIKKTIEENPIYHAVFPKVKPNTKEKWADGEWRVMGCDGKDPTFQAQGRRGSILGSRLNFAALDDLIKQEEVQSGDITPKEVLDIIDWIEKTFMYRLDIPGACAWMNGTRWLEHDPSGHAEQSGWDVILIPGLNEHDESYWPDRKPAEELHAMRDENPEAFALQFMGIPAPKEGIEFKAAYFSERYDLLPVHETSRPPSVYWQVQSWDPAHTRNKRSDYTAGITGIVDVATAECWITNLFHAKLEFYELLQAVAGLNMHQPSNYILIEEKGGGQELISMIKQQHPQLRGRIVPRQPPGLKGQDSLAYVLDRFVKPFCVEQLIHLPTNEFAMRYQLDWVGLFERNLYAFPRTTHDDIARAFIQLVAWLQELRSQRVIGVPPRLSLEAPRKWITPPGTKVRV